MPIYVESLRMTIYFPLNATESEIKASIERRLKGKGINKVIINEKIENENLS
jgi:hypothetical protein